MLNIQNLIDDAKCFETVRALRWPEGARCVPCGSATVTKQGRDPTQPERQKYYCKDCRRWFDDLTGTVFADIISRCAPGCCVCTSWGGIGRIARSPRSRI